MIIIIIIVMKLSISNVHNYNVVIPKKRIVFIMLHNYYRYLI